jgi:hypothetical protein
VRDHDRQNRWAGERLLLRFHDARRVAKGPWTAADPARAEARRYESTTLHRVPRPSTDEISKRVENTVYTAVGLGILGFQHLQVQRQQLKRAIQDALKKPKGARG